MIYMGKYVYVKAEPNKKGKYYKVNDFSFETISKMPFYKQKYRCFQLWEGEERHIDDDQEIYDIFPGKLVETVFYGKKISYKEVKKIILNDQKYSSLLDSMIWDSRNAFYNSITQEEYESLLKEKYDEEYIYAALFSEEREEKFFKKYDQEHYCIFYPPDTFIPCRESNMLSIEEYDKNIKLDYTESLSLISLNSQIGFDYINDKREILINFGIFFDALIRINDHVNPEELFEVISFNFNSFNGFDSLEDINFFLNYYKYAEGLDGKKLKILNDYIEYLNDTYNKEITH